MGLFLWDGTCRLRESIIPDQTAPAQDYTTDYNSRKIITARNQRWVHAISESYYGWLRHYRLAFLTNGKLPFNHPYVLGCLTTYEFAHMILNADVQDFDSFITILSTLKTTPAETMIHRRSQATLEALAKSICEWTSSTQAVQALTHALDLIDLFLLGESKYDVTKETAFHRTWSLYIACITVWIFQYFALCLGSSIHEIMNAQNDIGLPQYLARIRTRISKKLNLGKIVDNEGAYRLILDKKTVGLCEANVLLEQAVELLTPCRWGVSKYHFNATFLRFPFY